MNVELLQITPDALNFIGKCASICYDSDDQNTEKNIKRAIGCATKGHLATLRFAHATFRVSGISRVCSHQFVRSKHLDFLQRSQRYCDEREPEFIIPESMKYNLDVPAIYNLFHIIYKGLLDTGVKKEDARFILPQATATELIVTGNLQAWLDFVNLRMVKEAQWEIREVATEINNILAQELKGIFHEEKVPT